MSTRRPVEGRPGEPQPIGGRAGEVLGAFAKLGVTSFGGPIAHIGYFRREFVERRRWLSEAQFTQLVGITQLLPGPASSQLGFALGLLRAGWLGALAAFAAFTLPSAALLYALSASGAWLSGAAGAVAVHGLKLVAVAVVAHAVVQMARRLTPDLPRIAIGVLALGVLLFLRSPWAQLLVIAGGALAGGLLLPRTAASTSEPAPAPPPASAADSALLSPHYGRATAATALALFALLLAFSFWWPSRAPVLGGIWASFSQAGALVFGGGHVVLPLLERSVVATGWVSAESFLAGYGAAQAVPGPMFSVAAYLGAQVPTGASPLAGALTAVAAIFLPGFLLVVAVLPAWARLTARPRALQAIAGANAAVVGLLAAALYDPIWTAGVGNATDAVVAVIGLGILWSGRRSPLWTVAWCLAAAGGLALINIS